MTQPPTNLRCFVALRKNLQVSQILVRMRDIESKKLEKQHLYK